MTLDHIISEILEREGGYCDRAADKGGPTNHGITIATLSAWRKTACTVEDVRTLSALEAAEIVAGQYITAPGFDRIHDEALRFCVVDAGVNHGPGRPVKWLQRILALTDDGVLGPKTLNAVNAADAHVLRARFLAARVRFYGRIIADDANRLKADHGLDTQGENAAGWLDRAADQVELL